MQHPNLYMYQTIDSIHNAINIKETNKWYKETSFLQLNMDFNVVFLNNDFEIKRGVIGYMPLK